MKEPPILPLPTTKDERAEHLAQAHIGLAGYSDEQTHGNDHWRATEGSEPNHTHPGWPGAPDFEG